MRELRIVRLTVHRTSNHIYAQVIDSQGESILTQASTLESAFRTGSTGNIEAAKKVGELVAARAKDIGVSKVAFDRSGFKFHGRVKALADAAREAGLEF